MRNLIYLFILFTVITTLSCSEEGLVQDNLKVEDDNTQKVKILPLSEINNGKLIDQIPVSVSQLKNILAENYNNIYNEHNLNDLNIDEHAVVWINDGDKESFTFNVIIPHNTKNETFNLYAHLTLNFIKKENTYNNLVFGYYYDESLNFDASGTILFNTNLKYYSSKPSNIPAKAPKRLFCWLFRNGGWPNGLNPWMFGCGTFGIVPLSLEELNLIFYGNVANFNHSTNNLYVITPNHSEGVIPFSFYSNNQFTVKSEIIAFYHKVYVPQIQNITYAANLNFPWHVHKQAFIDSYFLWAQNLSTVSPNTAMYLAQNNQVSRDIFNIFADYNLYNIMEDGVYLGVQWGQFSPNINLSRLTKASNYLLTPSGFNLIQQYGSGQITNQHFRNILNNL